jgi:predicted transcriptional regulator
MKHNTNLAFFNSGKGVLIILRILYEHSEPITKTMLAEEFDLYNIGRTVFNSSMEVCYKMQLVNSKPEQIAWKGSMSLMHSLTEKGKLIAEKVKEIDTLLL